MPYTHPNSIKKDWKVGDVRGIREVIFPLDATHHIAYSEWGITLGVMLFITVFGLWILFLTINTLRKYIAMLSKTNNAYDRFVPHEFLSYLKKESIVDVNLSDSVEKEMSIVFADIRNFTQISETMTPEECFAFLNSYYSVMGPIVRKNHGFIDKYIGDSIMALFEDTDDALYASIEMQTVLKTYNSNQLKEKQGLINIGIGLHKGRVRLGTVGEKNRMDGTVISDAVNLSSRIEALTKLYGVEILITETVYQNIEEIHKDSIRLLGKLKVKGRQELVTIYEVFSSNPQNIRTLKRALKNDFEQAVTLYQAKEFEKAQKIFKQHITQLPDDKPATLYIERCVQYMTKGLPDDWNSTFIVYEH